MRVSLLLIAAIITLQFIGCKKEVADKDIPTEWDVIPMNQIQVLASHNSYRKKTYPPIYDSVQKLKALFPPNLNPDGWDYTHLPFEEQFNTYGVRSLEIDVYYDPTGGRFYDRGGMALVGEPVSSGITVLQQPGYKVLHIPDMDFETNYYTFKDALLAVKNWSNAHPKHIPITLYIETKQETAGDKVPVAGFVKGIPYTAESANELDAEIKSVFGANLDKVITPDKLRGNYTTLREAALAGNWPKLKDARGKILFVMNGGMESVYKQGKPSLEGRAMFMFADTTDSFAAFIIENTAPGNETQITTLVKQGFMVRTRADGETIEARTGSYSRSIAAFNSGAQIVSTDYYKADYRCDTSSIFTCYKVEVPGKKLARISPAFAATVAINTDLAE
jgi:hypothetical protein